MKTILLLSIGLFLASCSAPAEWANTPNPLDVPGGQFDDGWHPAAHGYFGPFGNGPATQQH